MNENSNRSYPIYFDRLDMLHHAVTPAEVRQGEHITAILKYKENGTTHSTNVRVWRLSPMGIEVPMTKEIENLKLGDAVEFEITVGKQLSILNAQNVVGSYQENGVELLGFRFCPFVEENWTGIERRTNKRWSCSTEFMPTGVAPNPGRFNDFLFFRISDISSSGCRILTSLRNKFLLPGMILESTVSFPMIGQAAVKFQIKNSKIINEQGKDVLSLGVEFVDVTPLVKELIGQYIFQFGPRTSLQSLSEQDLSVEKTYNAVDFRFVRTEQEFLDVLKLRLASYQKVGKLDVNASLKDVTDAYDTRSRIVIAVHQGEVVASMRLIFNDLDDQMEHEQFVTFPAGFPRKDEICEITRVCIHPEYQGSTILLDLFSFSALSVVQSKRKYVLGSAAAEKLPFYKNVGFKPTSITYQHASLNNLQHTIFLGNVPDGLAGEGVNPIYWNIVWGGLYQYLSDLSYLNSNPAIRLRIALYRLFQPLSWAMYRFRKLKRKKGRKKKQ